MISRLFFLFMFYGFSLKAIAIEIENISVDAYKEERSQIYQTSSSFEIPAKQIKLTSEPAVSDILRDNPSIDVVNQGGNSSLFLRGMNAEHTMVLIDGIVVNDPSSPGRSFNMGLIDTLAIEKIEILPGSRGFLHGSDAIGGVINIVTKSPKGSAGDWHISGGIPENMGISVGKDFTNNKNAGGRVSFHILRQGGFSTADESLGNTEEDEQSKIQGNLKGFWEYSDQVSLDYSFQYSHQSVDLDLGGGVNQDDPNFVNKNVFINTKAFLRFQPSKDHIFKFGLGYNYTNRDTENEEDLLNPDTSINLYHSFLVKPEVIYEYTGENISLYSQLHYAFERADIYSLYNNIESSDDVWDGINYAASIKISNPVKKKILWEIGARYSGNPDVESAFTYLLGIGYRFQKLKLRGSLSSGFKNPSLFQLFDPTVGNINLVPEKSVNAEVGLDYHLSRKVKLSLNYYQIKLQDQIGFTTSYVNNKELTSNGLEVEASLQVHHNFGITLWANFLNIDGEDLRKPRQKGGAKFYYKRDDWDAMLRFRFVGEREDRDFTSGSQLTLASYQTIDLSLKYQLNPKLSLGMSLLNLGDTEYTEVYGYTTLGRRVIFSIDGVF